MVTFVPKPGVPWWGGRDRMVVVGGVFGAPVFERNYGEVTSVVSEQPAVGLFIKSPRVGAVKTRLGRSIGMRNAAEFYVVCVGWMLYRLDRERMETILFYTPGEDETRIRDLFGLPSRCTMVAQEGRDLGERMYNGLCWLAREATGAPVILGSDVPDLPLKYVRRTGRILNRRDLVVGPARDGGYYLIATRDPRRELFEGMEWSQSNVLEETLSRARRARLSTYLLPRWRDVDTLRDLIDRL